jgi:hypothetical protein
LQTPTDSTDASDNPFLELPLLESGFHLAADPLPRFSADFGMNSTVSDNLYITVSK